MPWYNPRILNLRGSRWVVYPLVLLVVAPLLWEAWLRLDPHNGFDLGNASVVGEHIQGGGVGRDDIPALTDPAVLAAGAADYLDNDDLVLGVVRNGEARAYPLRILNWHEIVNDRLGGEAVAVTFCPLCRTGVAFRARLHGERLDFGVSGLLYRDNLLMFDRQSRSLWSQLMGEAVSGPRVGAELQRLPVEHVTWRDWRIRYPETTVLSTATGYWRDYGEDPYRSYADAPAPRRGRERLGPLPARARVIGIEMDAAARAYPLAALALDAPSGVLKDTLGGRSLRIEYDVLKRTASVRDASGVTLPSTLAFWSAWQDFHPQGDVWAQTQ